MIQHIHFIGFGLMAASLSAAIRRSHPAIRLTAESADEGAGFGVEKSILDSTLTVDSISDPDSCLVIIATPVTVISKELDRLKNLGYPGWITDIGSVKSSFHEQAGLLGLNYFGGHPMTGSEKQSARHFNPVMYENAVYVLTPPVNGDWVLLNDFERLLQSVGALPLILEPAIHDEIAATISHLPQLLAVALVGFVAAHQKDNPAFLQLAAGGFRDMTRIASSPEGIWKDILTANRPAVQQKLSGFIHFLTGMEQELKTEDISHLMKRFSEARFTRDSIPRNTKGFIHPLFDLMVLVEDQPGVIFTMSKLLFENGINIRDMELIKVREGLQGAFRLSFSTETDWTRANQLLNENGFQSQRL